MRFGLVQHKAHTNTNTGAAAAAAAAHWIVIAPLDNFSTPPSPVQRFNL